MVISDLLPLVNPDPRRASIVDTTSRPSTAGRPTTAGTNVTFDSSARGFDDQIEKCDPLSFPIYRSEDRTQRAAIRSNADVCHIIDRFWGLFRVQEEEEETPEETAEAGVADEAPEEETPDGEHAEEDAEAEAQEAPEEKEEDNSGEADSESDVDQSAAFREGVASAEEFVNGYVRIVQALLPRLDAGRLQSIAEREWSVYCVEKAVEGDEVEGDSRTGMTWDSLLNGLLELADLWCRTTDIDDVILFLDTLFCRTSVRTVKSTSGEVLVESLPVDHEKIFAKRVVHPESARSYLSDTVTLPWYPFPTMDDPTVPLEDLPEMAALNEQEHRVFYTWASLEDVPCAPDIPSELSTLHTVLQRWVDDSQNIMVKKRSGRQSAASIGDFGDVDVDITEYLNTDVLEHEAFLVMEAARRIPINRVSENRNIRVCAMIRWLAASLAGEARDFLLRPSAVEFFDFFESELKHRREFLLRFWYAEAIGHIGLHHRRTETGLLPCPTNLPTMSSLTPEAGPHHFRMAAFLDNKLYSERYLAAQDNQPRILVLCQMGSLADRMVADLSNTVDAPVIDEAALTAYLAEKAEQEAAEQEAAEQGEDEEAEAPKSDGGIAERRDALKTLLRKYATSSGYVLDGRVLVKCIGDVNVNAGSQGDDEAATLLEELQLELWSLAPRVVVDSIATKAQVHAHEAVAAADSNRSEGTGAMLTTQDMSPFDAQYPRAIEVTQALIDEREKERQVAEAERLALRAQKQKKSKETDGSDEEGEGSDEESEDEEESADESEEESDEESDEEKEEKERLAALRIEEENQWKAENEREAKRKHLCGVVDRSTPSAEGTCHHDTQEELYASFKRTLEACDFVRFLPISCELPYDQLFSSLKFSLETDFRYAVQRSVRPFALPPVRSVAEALSGSGDDTGAIEYGSGEWPRSRMSLFGEHCPVSYAMDGVLVKGSPEFAVAFSGAVYFFASAEYQNTFLDDPKRFTAYVPHVSNVIVGCLLNGSGTIGASVAQALGDLYRLRVIDVRSLVDSLIRAEEDSTLVDWISNGDKTSKEFEEWNRVREAVLGSGETVPDSWICSVVAHACDRRMYALGDVLAYADAVNVPLLNNGSVLVNFPTNAEQVNILSSTYGLNLSHVAYFASPAASDGADDQNPEARYVSDLADRLAGVIPVIDIEDGCKRVDAVHKIRRTIDPFYPSAELVRDDNADIAQTYDRDWFCGEFCPVALAEDRVLRKGSRDYTVMYDGSRFLCSSEEAATKFCNAPLEYVPLGNDCIEQQFPPPHIWAIGAPHSGRHTLSSAASRAYGIPLIDTRSRYLSAFLEEQSRNGDTAAAVLLNEFATVLTPQLAQQPADTTSGEAEPNPSETESRSEAEAPMWTLLKRIISDVAIVKAKGYMLVLNDLDCIPSADQFAARVGSAYPDQIVHVHMNENTAMYRKRLARLPSSASVKRIHFSDGAEPGDGILGTLSAAANDVLSSIRDAAPEIPVANIDASRVERHVRRSFVEAVAATVEQRTAMRATCTALDTVTCQRLLTGGYCRLSSLGPYCPQSFMTSGAKHTTSPSFYDFPVKVGEYIYCCSSEESRAAFMQNGLDSLRSGHHPALHCTPPTVIIVGPKGIGCSTLARSLSTRLGCVHLDLEIVGERLMRSITTFGASLRKSGFDVRSGEDLWNVFAYVTQLPECRRLGWVLDLRAFHPSIATVFGERLAALHALSTEDAMDVLQPGCMQDLMKPKVVLHVDSSDDAVLARCSDIDTAALAEQRASIIRLCEACDGQFQNVLELDGANSRWSLFEVSLQRVHDSLRSCDMLSSAVERNVSAPLPHTAFPRSLVSTMLSMKCRSYCPVQLVDAHELWNQHDLSDLQHAVLYEGYIYLCSSAHAVSLLLASTVSYLDRALLPADLPVDCSADETSRMVSEGVDLALEGYCPVSVTDSATKAKSQVSGDPDPIEMGVTALGLVTYRDNVYAFSSTANRTRFLRRPWKFNTAELPVNRPPVTAEVDVCSLPTVGYLSSSLSDALNKVLVKVGEASPKIPYLSAQQSAAVYIGAQLRLMTAADDLQKKNAEQLVSKVDSYVKLCDMVRQLGLSDDAVVKMYDDLRQKQKVSLPHV